MTDGTSQGLFIVVAIVIFGIFTVLAYILFEDTLSPAMANMFTEATEKAVKDLNGGIKLDTNGFRHVEVDAVIADFSRRQVDNPGVKATYGDFGSYEPTKNAYALMNDRTIDGNLWEIINLSRVYVLSMADPTYNFVRGTVHIDNKLIGDNYYKDATGVTDMYWHFIDTHGFIMEENRNYVFEYRLYKEDGDYIEFKKTFYLKSK